MRIIWKSIESMVSIGIDVQEDVKLRNLSILGHETQPAVGSGIEQTGIMWHFGYGSSQELIVDGVFFETMNRCAVHSDLFAADAGQRGKLTWQNGTTRTYFGSRLLGGEDRLSSRGKVLPVWGGSQLAKSGE